MPEEISNPHDLFFRAAFSRLDVARDFLKNYLPPEIAGKFDLATLEIAQESFTDEHLKAHQTDFLFRIQLKTGEDAFVFILLEHKSYADELAAFQLLRYMLYDADLGKISERKAEEIAADLSGRFLSRQAKMENQPQIRRFG